MARLLSVNVGKPREIAWREKMVFTSVWKTPVVGRRLVRRLNIDGDAQGDLAGHGGEHRAVMVYQMDSYHHWEGELKRNDFTFGQFGENFTVEGLADSEVSIGDRFRIGEAEFEVTQPRVTCYRVGIRMSEPRMAALLVAHHRPGFYLRVLKEGEVGASDGIVKIADGPERLSVADCDALLYLPGATEVQLERALRIPALSAGWKSSFEAMLRQMTQPGSRTGNAGLASSEQMVTAAPGFRRLKVARIDRETVRGDHRAQFFGHPHQIGEGVGLHLSHDFSPVSFDRDLANTQLGANLLIEQAGNYQAHDLAFARRK
jgi:MOSC domain-containing protein YiiM